jgi:hypothetical protein
MRDKANRWPVYLRLAWIILLFAGAGTKGRSNPTAGCRKVLIEGEVHAGQEWKAPLGQGWDFRVLPIQPGRAGYSGWDLVVDREPAAGFPDALLLATLPYNSINEREVGTTFGLRAQDAVGWNPRSFRFLSDPGTFREGQALFRSLVWQGAGRSTDPKSQGRAMARLLELQKHASAGEFRILDVGLVPGVADAAPYAENWALASARTPHQIEVAPSGRSTARGSLEWLRFAITLWLPQRWDVPARLHAVNSGCLK